MFFVCSVSTSKTSGLSVLAGPPYMMLFLLTETNCSGTKFLKFWVGCLSEVKEKERALLQNVLLNNCCLAEHQITYLYHFILLDKFIRKS